MILLSLCDRLPAKSLLGLCLQAILLREIHLQPTSEDLDLRQCCFEAMVAVNRWNKVLIEGLGDEGTKEHLLLV